MFFERSKRVFVEDLSYEKSLTCVKINLLVELILSDERFRTKTRFGIEAKGNSENDPLLSFQL